MAKEVHLTESEMEKLKTVAEAQRQMELIKAKYEMLMAEFWYELRSRKGSGNFRFDGANGKLYEMTYEEIQHSKQ